MKGEDGRRKGEIKTLDLHPSAQLAEKNPNSEIFFHPVLRFGTHRALLCRQNLFELVACDMFYSRCVLLSDYF